MVARKQQAVDNRRLDQGEIAFETEGRLLQELGERLVASPEIALVELIKNAYDADAVKCEISLEKRTGILEVRDDGHGMTLEQFSSRWMRIATSHKLKERESPKFGRHCTGQKGIGRFAVRFLGTRLKLISVAWDKDRKTKTRLEADFDWPSIDKSANLQKALVPYTLTAVKQGERTGTILKIGSLRQDPNFIAEKEFRTEVLRIVSPLDSLEHDRFDRQKPSSNEDPGFGVILPGGVDGDGEIDLASQVLRRAWAQLTVNLKGDSLTIKVKLSETKKTEELKIKVQSKIDGGLFADIRFFPRRSGVFSDAGFDGREAWSWVRRNCGVAVVDRGFRMRPYGFSDNDWLSLDRDAARNERDWQSSISKKYFSISEAVRNHPGENPALNLPHSLQLVGAVFVESGPSGVSEALTPSMDREGFLLNQAYEQLVEVVRSGIEFLALVDKQDILRQQEVRAKEIAKQVRTDFKAAVEWIRESPTLTRGDKARLVTHYSELSKKLEDVEDYDKKARRKLETMSLLGVVAGFMTHEAARILDGLEKAIDRLRKVASSDERLSDALKEIETGFNEFKGHVEYTNLFVDSLHQDRIASFKSAAQIRLVIDRFGKFAKDRGIDVKSEMDQQVQTPPISIALYSGILLNLYTNSLKAVLAAEHRGASPHIVFRGWNESKRHVIEVLDKGTGVPPELRKRIFDPLFTTTSNLNNPLGSGMGLGLSAVRELVTQIGGSVELEDPPSGFSTCFRVVLPRTL